MNILFYYPDKERAVSLSSLMIAFQKQDHQVFLLTHADEGDLHNDVKTHGVKTYTYQIKKNISLLFYLKHILFLISFTRKNKIYIVYSHIQRANIISVFAQIFSRARFILCRHHSDCAYIDNNLKEKSFDRVINLLGKEFIAPSQKVYNQMVNVERVNPKKIHHIRYAYDFNKYDNPDIEKVKEIRKKYPTKLLLVKIARLIPEKRHILLLRVIKKLIEKNYNIKLLLLSEGWEKKNLEKYNADNNLQNNIFMLGYNRNVMDYLKASDIVVHVSASEASSNLAKEAGLCEKPIIVCKDVGDFDEYITDKVNGFLISSNNTEQELYDLLIELYQKPSHASGYGKALKQTVLKLFSIENIISEYSQFHQVN